MPQEVGFVELLRADVSEIKWDEELLILDVEFAASSGQYGFKTVMRFSKENEMINHLFDHLLFSCQALSSKREEKLVIENKEQIALPLRSFLRRYLDAFGRYLRGELEAEELTLLQTSGIDFANPEVSLHDKGREERVEILFHRARNYYCEKYYDLGLRSLSKILLLAPDLPKAHHLRGLCYRELGHFEEAIRSFQLWKEGVPSIKKEPFFILGDLYFLLERYERGIQLYDEYLLHFPGDPRGYLEYAQFLYRLRNRAYLHYLDLAYQSSPSLVKGELKKRWIFEFAETDVPLKLLTAHQARTYLGMDEVPFAQMTRKKLLPAHFCTESCRYFFDQQELDSWSEIANRYDLFDKKYTGNAQALDKVRKDQQRKSLNHVIKLERDVEENQLALWSLLRGEECALVVH